MTIYERNTFLSYSVHNNERWNARSFWQLDSTAISTVTPWAMRERPPGDGAEQMSLTTWRIHRQLLLIKTGDEWGGGGSHQCELKGTWTASVSWLSRRHYMNKIKLSRACMKAEVLIEFSLSLPCWWLVSCEMKWHCYCSMLRNRKVHHWTSVPDQRKYQGILTVTAAIISSLGSVIALKLRGPEQEQNLTPLSTKVFPF